MGKAWKDLRSRHLLVPLVSPVDLLGEFVCRETARNGEGSEGEGEIETELGELSSNAGSGFILNTGKERVKKTHRRGLRGKRVSYRRELRC